MQIQTLLDGVTATGSGQAFKVDRRRTFGGGPIALVLTGVTTATVVLEGTIATDDEVRAGDAAWAPIEW